MVNKIFNKPWYQKNLFDRISNKRYSKRHSYTPIIRWRIVYPDGRTSEWRTEKSICLN